MVNGRADLLRAHVYQAHAARGTDDFSQAVRDAVDGWTLFPAVAAAYALECARAAEDAAIDAEAAWCESVVQAALSRPRGRHPGVDHMDAWVRESVALMRSTYAHTEAVAV